MKLICATAACFVALALMSGAPLRAEELAKTEKFKLPDNPTSKSLIAFCKALQQTQPASEQEADEMQAKKRAACRKILELEKGDGTPEGRYGKRWLLIAAVQDARDPSTPEFKKALDELIAFAIDPKFTLEDVQLASELGDALEKMDMKRALEFYANASKVFSGSKDPDILEASKGLAGTARRANLVGNEMELKGTNVDGKPFDIASLKGKVVLVDFWATWCHYCVEEIPNVKRNYMGYHGKGFEVVAISADEDRAALNDFLAQNKLPWINLHDEKGQNPAMAHYAIRSYPTTFLVGQDGKVVSLNARGKELEVQLKKLLGDPDPIQDLPKAEAPKAAPLQSAIEDALKNEK